VNDVEKRKQPGWKNIIAWGSGDIFGSGSGTIIGLWMLYFFTQVAGLSPVEAGLIFAIGKLWDAITDPIVAYITDNIRTRFGRRKVFFLFGAPFLIVFGLMFISGFGFAYYLATYLLFNTMFTVVMTPYCTLPNEMTDDYEIRTKMGSCRLTFGQITAFVVTLIPGLIMSNVEDEAQAFIYIGFLFGFIFTLPWYFIYKYTWEIEPSRLPPQKEVSSIKETLVDLYKEMASTLQIKTFRIHLMMYIGGSVALDIFGALFLHYITFNLNLSAGEGGQILSVMTFMQFFGVLTFTWFALKIGNANAYKIALGLMFVSLAFFAILPNVALDVSKAVFFGAVLIGLARGGIYLIPWVIFNSIPDVDEILTRRRRAGIFSGVMTLGRKICQASAMLIASIGLQWVGFESGAKVQTSETISGVYWLFLIGPTCLAIIALFGATLFQLTKQNHRILIDEVSRLRNGGAKQDALPQVVSVVEELTGWEYKYMWGDKKKKETTYLLRSGSSDETVVER